MKSARERMDIVNAYAELGSYRAAATLCGTTHKTAKRVVERQRTGAPADRRPGRPRNTDAMRDLIAERVQASAGRISAKRLLPLARPAMATLRGRRLALAGSMAHPERVPPAAAYRLVRAYARSPGFSRANAEMRRTVFAGIETIRVPVTLAWSDRDRLVGRPKGNVPGVRMLTLVDCGHVPTWDSPEQVVAAILSTTRAAEAERTSLSA